jgi:hypothetical protein
MINATTGKYPQVNGSHRPGHISLVGIVIATIYYYRASSSGMEDSTQGMTIRARCFQTGLHSGRIIIVKTGTDFFWINFRIAVIRNRLIHVFS